MHSPDGSCEHWCARGHPPPPLASSSWCQRWSPAPWRAASRTPARVAAGQRRRRPSPWTSWPAWWAPWRPTPSSDKHGQRVRRHVDALHDPAEVRINSSSALHFFVSFTPSLRCAPAEVVDCGLRAESVSSFKPRTAPASHVRMLTKLSKSTTCVIRMTQSHTSLLPAEASLT